MTSAIDDDDFAMFNTAYWPAPSTCQQKTTTWNGRTVHSVPHQPCSFIHKRLPIPTNDLQQFDGKITLLLVEDDDEEEVCFEEEDDWEIAAPGDFHTSNADEEATVEEILARSGYSFNPGQEATNISCKSLKHHVKHATRKVRDTGRRCRRVYRHHKKEILIGAAVAAVVIGVGVVIATAGAGAVATSAVSAGAGAAASRVPSRRKEEDGVSTITVNSADSGNGGNPPQTAPTDFRSLQFDTKLASAYPLTPANPITSHYPAPHELIPASSYKDISTMQNFKPSGVTVKPPVNKDKQGGLPPKPVYLNDIVLHDLELPPHSNRFIDKDVQRKIVCATHFPIGEMPKEDGQAHLKVFLGDVMSVPRSGGVKIIPTTGLSPDGKADLIVLGIDWSKMHFTFNELNSGVMHLDNHLREFIPKKDSEVSIVGPQNGINTSSQEFEAMGKSLYDKIPEKPVILGLYNRSEGLPKDIWRTLKEINGKQTPITGATKQFLVMIAKRGSEINEDFHFLQCIHSESGAIHVRAIEGMSIEERKLMQKHLDIIAAGPALPLSKKDALNAVNIYSKEDYVTKWFAKKFLNHPDYKIKIVPCISSWSERSFYIADHARDGETYDKALEGQLNRIRKEYGFYETGEH